ncbi:hypothetical protein RDABS01_006081 [Bienertia sinuspersici]
MSQNLMPREMGSLNIQKMVKMQIHCITADPDPSVYPNQELIVFQQVESATFTGTGTIDVNQPPQSSDPEKEFSFMEVLPSVKFSNATSCVVHGIHSMNPSAFHVLVVNSHNISIVNSNFESKTVKPNTHSNGVYISGSTAVSVTNTHIKTGDDCITVSGGSSDVNVSGVIVGAQLDGAHPDYNVKGVKVTNCTFKGTAFGARINPRPTDKPSQISNIIFENLVMEQALNPIVIKQDFPALPGKPNYAKITDVHFKNIRGTTTTNAAVSFACNKATPCEGIDVADINLTGGASLVGKVGSVVSANCANAKVVFSGKHDGLNCA